MSPYASSLTLTLINAAWLAVLGTAWLEGYLDGILAAPGIELLAAIVVVFLLGAGRAQVVALRLDIELQRSITAPFDILRIALAERVALVERVASVLVYMGLIGTVIGFIIALSGIEPEMASDVARIGAMVSTLIDGMAIALHTTLVGAVLSLWLTVLVWPLRAASVRQLRRCGR